MSPVVHTGAALLGWQLTAPKRNAGTLLIFVFFANLPDVDFLFFLFLGRRAFSMHQFYTHNVFFVALVFLLMFPLVKRYMVPPRSDVSPPISSGAQPSVLGMPLWCFGLALTALSHLVLDLFTRDIAPPFGFRMFYPFWDKLFHLGFFPNLAKSNIQEIFSLYNVGILSLEAALFVLPTLIIYRKQWAVKIKSKEFWRP